MDTNLPSLDIVEDIEEVMNDDIISTPTPQTINDTIEDVKNMNEEDNSPFIQKEKPKKELSEKQKAHLDRIRKLALEKKKEKTRAKKEALEKVEKEHKPRSYKPKKTQEQKKYEEKTIKMEIKEPREEQKNNQKKSTPDDFNVSHKKKLMDERLKSEEKEKLSFMNFMGHMENYLKLKDDYDRKKRNETPPKPQPTPKVKPQATPIALVPPKLDNPYGNYFG